MSEHEETYQENISALLDGELSEQEARALRACIETSEDPRAVFQAFSAVEAALPDAFPEVPAGLHEHIISGVRQAASQQAPGRPRRSAPFEAFAAMNAAARFGAVYSSSGAFAGKRQRAHR